MPGKAKGIGWRLLPTFYMGVLGYPIFKSQEVIMDAVLSRIEDVVQEFDVNQLAEKFAPDQMLVIKNFLPENFVAKQYLPEVENCTPFIHRVRVPGFKKSGSVSKSLLKQHAPNLYGLYHSPQFLKFIEQIVGHPLCLSPEDDPHAVALYNYTEPGDHIGVHYDKSFYKGQRYTVLLGMIQDSVESKLVCYPGSTKLNRRQNPIEIYTDPGTLVVFNGDVLWHEVTPLGQQERRVILTMEFLTDARISRFHRWLSNVKDRYLYFGKE